MPITQSFVVDTVPVTHQEDDRPPVTTVWVRLRVDSGAGTAVGWLGPQNALALGQQLVAAAQGAIRENIAGPKLVVAGSGDSPATLARLADEARRQGGRQ